MNQIKTTGLHGIKKTQRFSSSIQQKRRNCYESQEKTFRLQLSPWWTFFFKSSLYWKIQLGLYLHSSGTAISFQIMLSHPLLLKPRLGFENTEWHHHCFNKQLSSTWQVSRQKTDNSKMPSQLLGRSSTQTSEATIVMSKAYLA